MAWTQVSATGGGGGRVGGGRGGSANGEVGLLIRLHIPTHFPAVPWLVKCIFGGGDVTALVEVCFLL